MSQRSGWRWSRPVCTSNTTRSRTERTWKWTKTWKLSSRKPLSFSLEKSTCVRTTSSRSKDRSKTFSRRKTRQMPFLSDSASKTHMLIRVLNKQETTSHNWVLPRQARSRWPRKLKWSTWRVKFSLILIRSSTRSPSPSRSYANSLGLFFSGKPMIYV